MRALQYPAKLLKPRSWSNINSRPGSLIIGTFEKRAPGLVPPGGGGRERGLISWTAAGRVIELSPSPTWSNWIVKCSVYARDFQPWLVETVRSPRLNNWQQAISEIPYGTRSYLEFLRNVYFHWHNRLQNKRRGFRERWKNEIKKWPSTLGCSNSSLKEQCNTLISNTE